MVDPVIEDAVNAVAGHTDKLRQALGEHGKDSEQARKAEEAVCLAVRFALALFLPAWVDAGGEYDSRLINLFRDRFDDALNTVPKETPYYKSIAERKHKFEEHVTGRKTSLIA